MGRAPVKRELTLIRDEKKRRSTFEQRKKSILKKVDELSSLCDVKVGIIIYGTSHEDGTVVSDNIDDMIKLYRAQPVDQKKKRSTTSSIILEGQMAKSKSDLSKLQKVNSKDGYPTWDKTYDDLSEEELRERVRVLDAKIQEVKSRQEFLEANQLVCLDNDVSLLLDQFDFSVPNPEFTDSFYAFNPTIDTQQYDAGLESLFECLDGDLMWYNDTQQYDAGLENLFEGLDGDLGTYFRVG